MSTPDGLDRVRALVERPAAPLAAALSAPSARRTTIWRTPRRLLALAVLTPLAGWAAFPGLPLGGVGWALLAGLALGAALTWSTYVPASGQRVTAVIGSPCGLAGALFPALGIMAAATPGVGIGGLVMGVGFVVMGLTQRLIGADSCRVP